MYVLHLRCSDGKKQTEIADRETLADIVTDV
jgi:hypothetical protein